MTELNEDNGDLLQKVLCMHCHIQCTQPCSRSQPTHASARDSCTLMGKSGLVSCGVTAFFSLVLLHPEPLPLWQATADLYLCRRPSNTQRQVLSQSLWGSPGVHKILMATGLEKVSFHSNPKETQCQRMFKLPHSCIHLTH